MKVQLVHENNPVLIGLLFCFLQGDSLILTASNHTKKKKNHIITWQCVDFTLTLTTYLHISADQVTPPILHGNSIPQWQHNTACCHGQKLFRNGFRHITGCSRCWLGLRWSPMKSDSWKSSLVNFSASVWDMKMLHIIYTLEMRPVTFLDFHTIMYCFTNKTSHPSQCLSSVWLLLSICDL